MSCVPELRFKEFSGEWEEKKLGEIAEIVGGGTPDTKNSNYWNGEINWFTPTEIGKTKYIDSSFRKISNEGLKHSSAKLLPKGTVLLSSRATIGYSSIILSNSTTNQGFQSLIVNKEHNNEFIYYLISNIKGELIRRSSGSTFLEISKKEIGKIKSYIPTTKEQEKIANFLSKIDEKIAILEDKLQLWETYKRGIIQQLFSQELRFKEDDGNSYPGWEEKNIEDIVNFSKGKGISKNDISEEGTECIRYGELYTTYGEKISKIVSKTNLPKKDLVLSVKYDIVIPTSGETAIDLATASCIIKDGVAIGGDTNILKTEENSLFLSYYLNNKRNEIASLAQGVSVVHLYASAIKELKIKIPSLGEQEKIANFLTTIDGKIQKIANELKVNKKFKKGLLQKMFC